MIEKYLKILDDNPCDRDFLKQITQNSSDIKQWHEKIVNLLLQLPYPTLQLVDRLKDSSRIITDALIAFLLQIQKPTDNCLLKFTNFLCNIPYECTESLSVRKQLTKTFFDIQTKQSAIWQIWMALLSRSNSQLIKELLLHYDKNIRQYYDRDQLFTSKYILLQALNGNLHCAPLISVKLEDFQCLDDVGLRNDLIILKIANELSCSKYINDIGNIQHWLDGFMLKDIPMDLQEIHNFFYADFQRINVILNFLHKCGKDVKNIKTESLMNDTSLLEILYNHDIDIRYDETCRIIDAIYKWNKKVTSTKCHRDLELETLTYFAALSSVYDSIMNIHTESPNDNSNNNYIQQLNASLRQIKNIDVLCSLLEDIFQLLFIRWEHLTHKSRGAATSSSKRTATHRRNSSLNSSDDDSNDMPTTPILLVAPSGAFKNGFICGGQALFELLSFLKNFVTKKLHVNEFKQASERIRFRFQRIVDLIAEALWKYSVLEKMDNINGAKGTQQNRLCNIDTEDLMHMVVMHADSMERSSSDDDRDRKLENFTRRKVVAKKRRRATFSGHVKTETNSLLTNKGPIQSSNNLQTKGLDDNGQARQNRENFANRSIIQKMLISPEHLAIISLALNNFTDVKYIIETYNIKNSELNQELSYMEQQQNIKQKLTSIYANYELQIQYNLNPTTPLGTVEQIRNVAAKGFEVSKIINVIDNFALNQRIQQSIEIEMVLNKYSHTYNFLEQFNVNRLNAIVIADLIMSLPFNFEITSSILMVIKRQQQLAYRTSSVDYSSTLPTSKDEASLKKHLPHQIGVMPFLENLCECMRLMEKEKTLSQVLCDNYYSLKPNKLSVELKRQKAFDAIFYHSPNELRSCEKLKSLSSLFHGLQSKSNYFNRFTTYVAHLSKLKQMCDQSFEYHISDLLKCDPYSIIGELIFEWGMTPMELESNVTALNLNLVHVIASNISENVTNKHTQSTDLNETKHNPESILNYICNQNSLLGYLLKCIVGTNSLASNDDKINSRYLERLANLSDYEKISQLYEGRKLVTALRLDGFNLVMLDDLKAEEQVEILKLQFGFRESQTIQFNRIDDLITNLIKNDARNICLASNIHNVELRASLLLDNFTKIATTRLAKELIETTLQHKNAFERIPAETRTQLQNILSDITVYAKVSDIMQFETWPQAYDFGMKTPNTIFERLLSLHYYQLCYEWCQVVKLAATFPQYKQSFMQTILVSMLQLNDDYEYEHENQHHNDEDSTKHLDEYLLKILESFPLKDCFEFLSTNKDKFRSRPLLQYAIDFLTTHTENKILYTNYRTSLIIFEQLTSVEREPFWKLIRYPLLILEQLLMNSKFEMLTKVMPHVQKYLSIPRNSKTCLFCFDKRGHLYDIHNKTTKHDTPKRLNFQLGGEGCQLASNSAFILLNFNLYQQDHYITNECIDLLLRIYATKALDFYISNTCSSSERISQTTDVQQSLDSLCGDFKMPRSVPLRDEWVQDKDATMCMCCRRSVFTMLIRRHHCRRCGRVVCFACSTYRMRIPEIYEDIEVRICNDCHTQSEDLQNKSSKREATESGFANHHRFQHAHDPYKWKLSGNITHDKLLREEFSYEHSPSVALSLSILGFHLGKQKCVDLLIYHCLKLEKLMVPNPEVDFELITKMMSCLALAAKVRGAPAEVETIRAHSDLIASVIQAGCESMIPPGPLSDHNIRKLADSLVQAEKWELALEVHLKFGLSTAGVMAAHGLACLRAGCYDTAREKFSHCMPKICIETINSKIYKSIFKSQLINDITTCDVPKVKRPQRGPPLLQEILKLIESIQETKPYPETLLRASIIRNSNTSIVSMLSRRKESTYTKPTHDPALHILTSLENIKRIVKGQYAEGHNKQSYRQTSCFEEAIYYVLTYGSHSDILQFLMQHEDTTAALNYCLVQSLDAEFFIQHIFLKRLSCGHMPALITQIMESDGTLSIWRKTLIQTCRYLETNNYLNSLYQLQVLLKDPIRASMTCVKFYTMNCENFQHLQANAQHLQNAYKYLQSELELAQWEKVNVDRHRKNSLSSNNRRESTSGDTGCFSMQMNARTLNSHINTILQQLEVTKFLATCEKEYSTAKLNTELILKQLYKDESKIILPTLFEGSQEKIKICILLLLCGKNIEEGFGLAYRIMQDHKLPAIKVFAGTSKYLAIFERLPDVEKLLDCISSNNGSNTSDFDEILWVAINSTHNSNEPDVKATLDNLAKKIHCVELRISSHIFIGQLKSAYLLANKFERLGDIKKILRKAELTNQIHVKRLCEKKLNLNAGTTHQQIADTLQDQSKSEQKQL